MKKNVRYGRAIIYFFLLSYCLLTSAGAGLAQSPQPARLAEGEESARGIWPPTYRGPKPKAVLSGVYRRANAANSSAAKISGRRDNTVGITLWRLRPPKATEQSALESGRMVGVKNGKQKEEVPERVSSDTVFSLEQDWRMGIEAPRNGYLYVIDRESYADGTLGEPYLIYPQYPEQRKNRMSAGVLTEIPNQEAEAAVFTFLPSPTKRAVAAEVLVILLTPKPLEGLPNGDGTPIKLKASVVEEWEKAYGAPIEKYELKDGSGQTYTRAEQKAGSKTPKKLTAADPLPQTVFRIGNKLGQPLILKLPLQVEQQK
jgi:hypothetical protein